MKEREMSEKTEPMYRRVSDLIGELVVALRDHGDLPVVIGCMPQRILLDPDGKKSRVVLNSLWVVPRPFSDPSLGVPECIMLNPVGMEEEDPHVQPPRPVRLVK